MANFAGQLNSNEIFSAIYNMIISQEVKVPKLANNYNFAQKFKTDGTLFGDTKLFYDCDVLPTYAWGNDAEANNLLALDRPAAPKCQAITIDTFRQVRLTVDNYLTKRAWATEGAFGQFNSVMLAMLGKAKEIHETTLVDAYIGSLVSGATNAVVNVDVTTATSGLTGEEKARVKAQKIAAEIANTIDDMADFSTKYNDYGFLRAFNKEDLMIIWNIKYVNEITKLDLPTIFHDTKVFGEFADKLPARYFGKIIGDATALAAISATTPAAGKPVDSDDNTYVPGTNNANGKLISLIETDVTVGVNKYHVLPGDELPAGCKVSTGGDFLLGEFAMADDKVICKIVSKDAIKFMGAFEVGTEFFNPRSLTSNHYLTFGYAKPDYLQGEAVITVKEV